MTDSGDPDRTSATQPPRPGSLLQCLSGGGEAVPDLDTTPLLREFKGLTVKELLVDTSRTQQLPGKVLAALREIERGDLAAAERALPGHFGTVLEGPGHRRRRRQRRRILVLVAVLVAATVILASLLQG